MTIKFTKTEIENVFNNTKSFKDCLTLLNLKHSSRNYKKLHFYIQFYNIDITIFKEFQRLDKSISAKKRRNPLEKMLTINSKFSRKTVKKRVLEEGLLENKCILCGQDENWNGKKISLILDHINGINNDNRIENLRIVCPNCNASLETFAGRNSKRKKKINNCYNNKNHILNPLWKKESSIKRRKSIRPSYKTLLKEVNLYGYAATGRKYGVSDNSIRKWLKLYNNN